MPLLLHCVLPKFLGSTVLRHLSKGAVRQSLLSCLELKCTILMHGHQLHPLASPLSLSCFQSWLYFHTLLRGFQKSRALPSEIDLIGLGCSLGIGILKAPQRTFEIIRICSCGREPLIQGCTIWSLLKSLQFSSSSPGLFCRYSIRDDNLFICLQERGTVG